MSKHEQPPPSEPEEPPPVPTGWIGVWVAQAKKAAQDPSFTDSAAKALASGYVFVGFILTTIAAFQGGLERLLLNHPWMTLIALLLLGAGIGIGFVDAFVSKAKSKLRIVLLGLGLFGAGLIWLMILSTSSLAEVERPGISATASMSADGSKLQGHVSAFGIKTKQWVYVSANGLVNSQQTEPGLPLYKTRAGPDRKGKVDISFEIPVAFNHFERVRIGAARVSSPDQEINNPCFESQVAESEPKPKQEVEENQSCATVFPPHAPERPTLSATLEKTGTTNILNVTAKASGVDPDDVIFLQMARPGTGTTFYRSMLSSSPAGVVDATAKAPVPAQARRVCVVATAISAVAFRAADTATRKKQLRKLRKQLGNRTCRLGSFDFSTTSFVAITVP